MRPRGTLTAILGVALICAATAAGAGAQAGVSYSVPADNPFVGQAGAREEIWAYGLRNPWRFSFDRASGDLNIADVGQNAVEEVDFAAAGTGAGANYGWNCFEGSQPYEGAPAGCEAPGHVPPVLEYSSANDQTRCSITGGYVVREPSHPLAGSYVYGDFCTGELRAAELAAGGATGDRALNLTVPAISSFGEDAAGRVYAASLGGPVFRLIGGVGPIEALLAPIGVFSTPVYVTSEPDDADRLYVVEKDGTIQLVPGLGPPTTFLDLSGEVESNGPAGERGLLSIAFAPDYATSGLLYVYFTDPTGDIRIEEFRRSATDPNVADPASRRLVLTQEHRQFANHNGGQLQFGPDGMLYAALGDGGGAGNPLGTAQDLGSLLGKLIRIDPRQP
ncbi:MAG: PQQ-dependent sugar dehydrogenase [Solirubrobacterales bacterium]